MAKLQQPHLEQWAGGQIETRLARDDGLAHPFIEAVGGHLRQIDDLERRFGWERRVLGGPAIVPLRKSQPQRIVMREHGVRGGRSGGDVHALSLETDRLIEVLRLGEPLLEEPRLHRREWRRALDRLLLHDHRRRLRDHGDLRQLGDRLLIEELIGRELQAGFFGARDDLDDENGVAAEIEQVVVDADAGDAQHLLPDANQRFLHRILRQSGRGVGGGRRLERLGQRLAIDLAVGGDRHPLEHHERRRHHELGQPRAQQLLELGDVDGPPVACDIRDQTLVAQVVLARDHRGLLHQRVLVEHRLDLTELDAVAANLDLVVLAPDHLEIAVGQPDAEVAGQVDALPHDKRTGNEFLRGELVAIEVAACHAGAADADFSDHTFRHGLQALIEQIDRRAGDRLADGDTRPVAAARIHLVVGHADGGLRGAVGVVVVARPRQANRVFDSAVIASADVAAHARQPIAIECAQVDRRQRQRRDPLPLDIRRELFGVVDRVAVNHHQRGAREQRHEDLEEGRVEAVSVKLQQPIRRRHAESVDVVTHHGDEAAMLEQHRLWLPRRSGRVDDVGEVAGGGHRLEVGVGGLQRLELDVEREHRRLVERGQPLEVLRVHQQHLHARVGHHELQPFLGIVGIDRQIDRPRLQYPQQPSHRQWGSLGDDANDVAGLDAVFADEKSRELVGAAVERVVGDGRLVELDRHVRAGASDLFLKELVNRMAWRDDAAACVVFDEQATALLLAHHVDVGEPDRAVAKRLEHACEVPRECLQVLVREGGCVPCQPNAQCGTSRDDDLKVVAADVRGPVMQPLERDDDVGLRTRPLQPHVRELRDRKRLVGIAARDALADLLQVVADRQRRIDRGHQRDQLIDRRIPVSRKRRRIDRNDRGPGIGVQQERHGGDDDDQSTGVLAATKLVDQRGSGRREAALFTERLTAVGRLRQPRLADVEVVGHRAEHRRPECDVLVVRAVGEHGGRRSHGDTDPYKPRLMVIFRPACRLPPEGGAPPAVSGTALTLVSGFAAAADTMVSRSCVH